MYDYGDRKSFISLYLFSKIDIWIFVCKVNKMYTNEKKQQLKVSSFNELMTLKALIGTIKKKLILL